MDDRAYILWTLADWAYIILAPIVLGGILVGASIVRWRRSKNKTVERVPATITKIIYESGFSNPQAYFLVEGERRPRRFDARRGFVVRMPEIGTKGMLTCKGHVLYSFEWADQKVVQDDPAYGKTGYADMI